ncbi:vam6/Vps39-like protein isoform X1 [Zootermopsis nevadensis]|uniref:vam6/Vps39-like protein isoform X1 n=1 Tax=Zootermopsis nevadensis TaxID=136037 RepID=UPI000B8E7878|nr:vam6/Vps39-like protein isoform X1 [Zootermopsis nevadensis]
MHDAYELAQLLKLTVQIESITAYDDNLLVGTHQGHLLMYSVGCRNGDQKPDVQLLRYNKNFSKKPIQQLAVVPEYQLLISLSDNVICVHDMTIVNFPTVTVVQRTRGATLFTLDIKKHTSLTGETSVLVRMCVAVKRKLQLFYWKNNGFLDLHDDLTVADVPRALAWCQETICVGFKGDYCLMQLSGQQHDLFPTGKHPEPSITKLSDNTFALGKDTQSIFMNTEGDPIQKYAVRWSEVPLAIAYDEPYLLALLADCVEIRTVEPCLFIQSVTVPKPRLVVRCRQGLVYVASVSHVWCLQAVPLARQIHILLEDKQFQLALKLTNISDESDEEKSKNIYQIQTLYAFDLFNNKQFHESMKEFLNLGTDPYEVIRLFPELLPQQSRGHQELEQRPKLQDRDLENGLLALIEFLTEVRHKPMKDTKLNTESSQQNSMTHKSTQQLLQIIDTTLLKCYLQTNDALVAPLLRLNHCHLGETEKTLKKHQKYSELIILYQTKGLHRKALELLQKLADHPDSSLHGYERTLQYLQHLGKDHINLMLDFAGWVLEANPEEGLKMFTEDIAEVEQLPRPKVLDYLLRTHKDLVIPYLEHVIHVWEDSNSIFHNALVHQYRERYQQLLVTSSEERQKTRAKLLQFLETSSHYTPETVFVHFPYDCLFEERAIVLGKLGRHEQALAIYLSTLGDVPRAIQYCDKVYSQGKKMLITPPNNSWLVIGTPSSTVPCPPPSDLETALSLLEEHASKIHPMKALSVLPDRVPLGRIRQFLEVSLQNKLNERRRSQVLKGLLYAEHLQVQELRMSYESQSILMTEFNVCPVCKKRFGNQSAFARYPNGDIVHYSCQDRRS